jgi:hypothetical protein
MSKDMKVTFECQKCGTTYTVLFNDDVKLMDCSCSCCKQMTHGTITEEVLAELLWEARKDRDDDAPFSRSIYPQGYLAMARAVIRLMDFVYRHGSNHYATEDGWRGKLMELARE